MIKLLTRVWGTGPVTEDGASVAADDTPKRKNVVPLWRLRSVRTAGVLVGIGLLSGMVVWSTKAGWAENMINHAKWVMIKVSAEQGLTVEDVLVTGRAETNRDDLLNAMGVARGAPILAYDFEAAKTRVESLPWVLSARVERLLPDTLVVHLIERRPMALWQNQGQFALIDEEGKVIIREDLGRFAQLIHVVGEDAPFHVGGLLELLDTQPDLKKQVRAAVRVGGRRWDLLLEGGIDVRLPEINVQQALSRLVDFERETGAMGREITILDLRTPDRVIVRKGVARGSGEETTDTPKVTSGQET